MPTPSSQQQIPATVSEATRLTRIENTIEKMIMWGGPSSDARAEWNKPFTIPGESQATREGEKPLKWGCRLFHRPMSQGSVVKYFNIDSPSGTHFFTGAKPPHEWAQQGNMIQGAGCYTEEQHALAALNACNTPPPDFSPAQSPAQQGAEKPERVGKWLPHEMLTAENRASQIDKANQWSMPPGLGRVKTQYGMLKDCLEERDTQWRNYIKSLNTETQA